MKLKTTKKAMKAAYAAVAREAMKAAYAAVAREAIKAFCDGRNVGWEAGHEAGWLDAMDHYGIEVPPVPAGEKHATH